MFTDNPFHFLQFRAQWGATAYDRVTKEIYEAVGLTIATLVPTEIKGFENTKALSVGARVSVGSREALPIPRTRL